VFMWILLHNYLSRPPFKPLYMNSKMLRFRSSITFTFLYISLLIAIDANLIRPSMCHDGLMITISLNVEPYFMVRSLNSAFPNLISAACFRSNPSPSITHLHGRPPIDIIILSTCVKIPSVSS